MVALKRSTEHLRFGAGLEAGFVLHAFAMRPALEPNLALSEGWREHDLADLVLTRLGNLGEKETSFSGTDDG
jgi:hypothetical protein